MASIHANFLECTTGTEGTGNITLVRKTGYPLPLDIYSASDTFEYTIKNGNNWETGLGTVNASNVLVRTTVYATWIDSTTTYDDTSPSALNLSGTSSVGVVNTGQNIDDPIVDTLTAGSITTRGDSSLGGTPRIGSKLNLPQENDPTTPTLSFGDGDSGFYEGADDSIRIAITGTLTTLYTSLGNFSGGATLGTAEILVATSTSTVPVYVFAGDADTGLGWPDPDQLSLITGNLEGIRITGTPVGNPSVITVDIFGNIIVNGDVVVTGDTLRVATQKTPASAAATGTKGDIVHDTNYIYVCIATDTWERAAIATW